MTHCLIAQDPEHRKCRYKRIAHKIDGKGIPVCGQTGNWKRVSTAIVGWFGYRWCQVCGGE